MLSKKLLGTLAMIAAVVASGSAAAGGSDPAARSAATPLSAAAVTSGHEALATRAGGELVGFADIPAEYASLRASGVPTSVAPDEAMALQEATQMESRTHGQVEALDVGLDHELVLHTTELDAKARHDIALNAIRADEDQITITAAGIGILALGTPARTAPDLPAHTAAA